MEIRKNTKISKIIETCPKTFHVMKEYGLECVSEHMTLSNTLEKCAQRSSVDVKNHW